MHCLLCLGSRADDFSIAEQEECCIRSFELVHQAGKLLRLIFGVRELYSQNIEVQVHANAARSDDVLDRDFRFDGDMDINLLQAADNALDASLHIFQGSSASTDHLAAGKYQRRRLWLFYS